MTHATSSSTCAVSLVVALAVGCSGGGSAASNEAGRGPGTGATGAGDSGTLSPDDSGGSNVVPGGDASGPAAATDSSAVAPDASGDATVPPGATDASTASALAGWTLTWSDEFNGPDGSAVDPTKWKHEVGGTGWGNNELEYYTDGTQNAVVQGGNLVVTATTQGASQYKCSYGTCKYTSARLTTQNLFSQLYGRFEARAQMPTGKGLWPAIWMLGDNISTVSWPACGEIDFMETIGTDISTNHGSLHMPNNYGPSGTFKLSNGASFADAFHTFAVEWEPGTVRFYVDEMLYETQSTPVPAGDTWEFNHPFFLLINVAVGGQWPGSPDSTTTFPQTLKVDWVRVYQKNGTEP
jgi:beta-glucanase (GH16 family)